MSIQSETTAQARTAALESVLPHLPGNQVDLHVPAQLRTGFELLLQWNGPCRMLKSDSGGTPLYNVNADALGRILIHCSRCWCDACRDMTWTLCCYLLAHCRRRGFGDRDADARVSLVYNALLAELLRERPGRRSADPALAVPETASPPTALPATADTLPKLSAGNLYCGGCGCLQCQCDDYERVDSIMADREPEPDQNCGGTHIADPSLAAWLPPSAGMAMWKYPDGTRIVAWSDHKYIAFTARGGRLWTETTLAALINRLRAIEAGPGHSTWAETCKTRPPRADGGPDCKSPQPPGAE